MLQKEAMTMLQGDSFPLPFRITDEDVPLTNRDLADVEICIGKLNKKYSEGTVTYEDGLWYFPFSQQETFAFRSLYQPIQIRLCFPSGDVIGYDLGKIDVKKALSNDILVTGNG